MEINSKIMDKPEPASDLDTRLATRLRARRADRRLTLDALAEKSGVSRSMISLIERGEASPTAGVLDRLANALGLTLAALFAEEPRGDASPLARRADQPLWRDPATGYLRRNLSPPAFPSPIDLVEVELPPGARVAYDPPRRTPVIEQQVWVLDGRLRHTIGEETVDLEAGDCLAMRIDRPNAFENPGDRPTRYLVALTTTP